MNDDDLTATWRKYDAKLDELAQTNALLLRRSLHASAQTALDRLTRTLRIELVIWALGALATGWFAAEHVHELAVLIATVAIDVYVIANLASTIAQLAMLSQIDYEEPVFAIARKVERLRLLRARTGMLSLFVGPLLWPAFAIAGLRLLLDVDPAAAFGLPWIAANVAFGIAVLALALWLARRYGSGARPASWFRRFSDTISGKDVTAASDELDALARYESEEEAA